MESKSATYPLDSFATHLKNPKPRLTEAEIEEIRGVFNLFAGEGTGLLNTSELKEAMKSLGFAKSNPKIYQMIEELDEKQGGKGMTFEEFLEGLAAPVGNVETKEGINKMFDVFVEDGGDMIALKHLEAAIKELGEDISVKEIEGILKNTASNGTSISREDFYNILSKKL